MKRTTSVIAAVAATALVAGIGFSSTAFAATKEPIAVAGSEDGCPTTWHYSYGDSRFYKGKLKVKTTGVKGVCIDVSEHNGKIDWKKIKKDGIKYAIIRVGYGQDHDYQDDKQWANNAKFIKEKAKDYGIKVGLYIYSYASNEVGAYGEAQHVLRCLKDQGLTSDNIELPIYYDLEHESVRPSNTMLARMTAVWCNAIAAEGYKVGVYSGAYWFMSYLTNGVFNTEGVSKWVANYNSACTYCRDESGSVVRMSLYGDYLDMWQFTSRGWSKGATKGINRLDTNFIFIDEFKKLDDKIKIPGNQIRYVLDGGKNSKSNPKKFSSSSQTVTLAKPTKTNYTFSGWYANGTKVKSISAKDYPAVTLTASWTPKKFYIDYDLNGGKNSAANVTAQKLADGALKLSNPTRTGYTFKGWYTSADFAEGSKVTSVLGKSKQTIKLYAKWTAKNYKLKYVLADGDLPAPYTTKYKITKRVQLPLPTREGYTFYGWYDNKELSGLPVFTLEKGTYGSKTLYGKWTTKYQNATVADAEVIAYANTRKGAAQKAVFKKGDALCITKFNKARTWAKVYKVGWVKTEQIKLPSESTMSAFAEEAAL